jgi:hypothetical protein
VLAGIQEVLPAIQELLFEPASARLAVAVSEVVTAEAAEATQGPGARRLGQQLVLATRTRDASWAEKHLAFTLFDTRSTDPGRRLGPKNLPEVAYATTRMLHAWKTPAWIDGRPFVDASYTCSCPAAALAELGCRQVIAVSPESGQVYTDFFQSSPLPESHVGVPIRVIQPARNLSEIGVDYLRATDEGLSAGYDEGRRAGEAFLAGYARAAPG